MMVRYTLFVTPQYDVILMFGEVCWHSVHILHTLSILVIVAYQLPV